MTMFMHTEKRGKYFTGHYSKVLFVVSFIPCLKFSRYCEYYFFFYLFFRKHMCDTDTCDSFNMTMKKWVIERVDTFKNWRHCVSVFKKNVLRSSSRLLYKMRYWRAKFYSKCCKKLPVTILEDLKYYRTTVRMWQDKEIRFDVFYT